MVIVSNRLPVSLKEGAEGIKVSRAVGGVATTLDAVAKSYGAYWVGWSGLPKVLSVAQLAAVRLPHGCVPVQAGADLIRRYYDRFSNQLLWPRLHGMPTSFKPEQRDWEAYQDMNRRFAHEVTRALRSADDLIWVHDYHLMLLPQYLRDEGVENRIGFFLHTPMAPAKDMIGLPHIRQLLAGLTAADVVGFQTKRDMLYFDQLLRLTGIKPRGRAGVFPIGTDAVAYQQAAARPSVLRRIGELRKQTNGRKVIFSLSRLDYTKGILTQLQAVERFLGSRPHPEQWLYKLVVAPSREQLGEYRNLKSKIEHAVKRINQKLKIPGWQPVDYSYENLGFEDVVAWYKTADMLLLLPDMDGMNLIAKEYVAARGREAGLLVLSKNIGSALQLTDALLVEPGDAEAAVQALAYAESMPDAEQQRRWQALSAVVEEQDVFWWADIFLSRLIGRVPVRTGA